MPPDAGFSGHTPAPAHRLPMDGILILHKPVGPTSHDMVSRVRRLLHTRRVGHAGTLDPPAEGVLVLFIGRATRLIEYTADADKEYVAECCFGAATDTLDASGTVTATADASGLTREAVEEVLPRFRGAIQQIPPMYSAIHHQGQRLYELARRGKEVERPPRDVVIHQLELLSFEPGTTARARLRVVCSKGTYIRALCADLGEALGIPAHMCALTRTRVGPFRIEDAVSLEELAEAASGPQGLAGLFQTGLLRPPDAAVAHLPCEQVKGDALVRVRHGNAIPVRTPAEEDRPVRIENNEGELVGIGHYERVADEWRLQPDKIME
ncbi:MAG TPA: tRNA pseudouridine(55) synthase TruB [Armatimonadota bacterium]|nr:tRNA pseudouridine(55) synthase TruB [Armatimonadota bacterium]HPO72492.1 tRNA pseudouridine(55) synthase TruB [Armatimonadota bacterium]